MDHSKDSGFWFHVWQEAMKVLSKSDKWYNLCFKHIFWLFCGEETIKGLVEVSLASFSQFFWTNEVPQSVHIEGAVNI